ncbi:NAD(P)H-dependent oxidoreductase [Mycolicibacterium sp.]|uniref:FMN-dependent NADH-azoreductase n=1 Tax=Mycolicibacterium sp. TaxID=2320850 RepID=UPI001A31080A|nr:NAD(P)H-dependent oxidoreductase [Mycolicibacterium sp.]MBJ7341875.1 NAD(P)H-dependent oxidoreductase [Mycolicibacterium sp.]
MTTLLHVSASPRGTHSDSLRIADEVIATYRHHHPDTVIDTVDLFDGTLPAFGRHAAEAKLARIHDQPLTDEQAAEWASARTVFERFVAADLYLFNIPMWNNGIPYVLKQWIDIISQPGWTFTIDDDGYIGLIHRKKAVVVYTSGTFAPTRGPAFGNDFQSTYFRDWLNLIGVTDVADIRLQPTIYSPTYQADEDNALAQARSLGATFL